MAAHDTTVRIVYQNNSNITKCNVFCFGILVIISDLGQHNTTLQKASYGFTHDEDMVIFMVKRWVCLRKEEGILVAKRGVYSRQNKGILTTKR